MPVVQFCDAAGVNMTPFAAVFVFNDIYYTFLSTIMSLGMVALCADAPFLSQYQMQVLLRTGRKRWLVHPSPGQSGGKQRFATGSARYGGAYHHSGQAHANSAISRPHRGKER